MVDIGAARYPILLFPRLLLLKICNVGFGFSCFTHTVHIYVLASFLQLEYLFSFGIFWCTVRHVFLHLLGC